MTTTMRAAAMAAILALAAWTAGPVPAWAQDAAYKARVERQFTAWLGDLWDEARAAGVTRATFDRELAGTRLVWNLPDLRPPGLEHRESSAQQPEFSSPGAYFNARTLSRMVASGRGLLARYKSDLDAIEARYRVPRGIVMSIWGRETSYGGAALPHDAIQALATQAFMGRRKDMFRPELIKALRILQDGHVTRAAMKSSWAGALGHPQFLPSDFEAHAVDHDGDGRPDIWNSVPDALASIANSLKHKGWRDSMSWGYEVDLPDTLPCTHEGPHQGRPFSEWVSLGVTRTLGRSFAGHLMGETGYLLLPAGRYGPAFIATDNFYVLKQYNESDVYALFVGHVADRYANDRGFAGGWGAVKTFRRDHVRDMQERMVRSGLDVGRVDGLIGFKTRVATGIHEQRHGFAPRCYPTPELMEHVRATIR